MNYLSLEDIQKAIRIIEESKATHVLWIEHFEIYPEHEAVVADTVHPKNEQLLIIKDYDHVIDVLKGFLAKQSLTTTGKCV